MTGDASSPRPVRRSTWRWHAMMAFAAVARYLPTPALKFVALRKVGRRIVYQHLQDIWQDERIRRISMLPAGRRGAGSLQRISQQDLGWAKVWPPDHGMQKLDRPTLLAYDTNFLAIHRGGDGGKPLAFEYWDLRDLRDPRRSLQNPVPVEGSRVVEGRGHTIEDHEGLAGHGPEAGKRQRWRVHHGYE